MKYKVKYQEDCVPIGPFTIEEIRSKTASNTIGHDYLAQGDGESHWTRVGVLLGDSSYQPDTKRHHDNNLNSGFDSLAIKRYADAYLVARTIAGVGRMVKIIAVVLGAWIILGAIVSVIQGYMLYAALCLLTAFIVATPIYVLGILVAAQGQILKATLDSAVHSSPFLKKEEMAKAMSL